MKKQLFGALILILLIPAVLMLGGFVSNHINPETAAGHANYARNFQILSLVKNMSMLAAFALSGILWLLACFLVIQSKGRSLLWLVLAVFGPVGFAILVMLKDSAPSESDRYARFVGGLRWFVRAGYEMCSLVLIWLLAYEAMVVLRNLIIWRESVTTGMSTAQVIAIQNASSGMWAFGEGLEVMYFVAFLYVIRPIVFNLVGRFTTATARRAL